MTRCVSPLQDTLGALPYWQPEAQAQLPGAHGRGHWEPGRVEAGKVGGGEAGKVKDFWTLGGNVSGYSLFVPKEG